MAASNEHPPAVTDDLIEACRRGDREAFEEVVRATYRQVYTQALRLVGDRQEAEDVTQDVYVRVFRGLSGFRGEAKFETWLYRVVANAAMSHLRRKGRFPDLFSDPPEDPVGLRGSSPPAADVVVDRQELEAALASLPLSLRAVVVLKDVYGLSHQEIGDHLGVSEGAVKVRLHRARRRLKERLLGREPADEV